ncbi:hypothetical protein L798_10109 [Zootermopsis nevadensis]|uniref:Uncharacterized protein n=1 Tax=Zootermopsis nevadensis TaxID=136037 RepID=A0A067R0V4_ZOONE|nr:hypothetical protein L798_10109 [Zootermopsis nevadensis]
MRTTFYARLVRTLKVKLTNKLPWYQNPQAQHRQHQILPPATILSQLHPFTILTTHLPEIHLDIIFPSPPWFAQWSFSRRCPYQYSVCTPCLPDFTTLTMLGDLYNSCSSLCCSIQNSRTYFIPPRSIYLKGIIYLERVNIHD